MSYAHLTVEARGPIEVVTLNRPQALKALSEELVGELTDYVQGLKSRRDCRVVVLRGAGRAFRAGLTSSSTARPLTRPSCSDPDACSSPLAT